MEYSDVYELMRAYEGSNLLVNKKVIGGRVSEFLDIPNSYRQTIRDEKGNETYYQFFEFKVPFTLKREKKIVEYLKNYFESKFKGKLLEVSDEEIERYNQYWGLDFIGLTYKFEERNASQIITPSGNVYNFSLEKGKELSDVYEVMFKPLPYTAGALK